MFSKAATYVLLPSFQYPRGILLALYYTGPTYHVILAYLELEQLPGSHALKVLDIRIDDRAHAEIHQ